MIKKLEKKEKELKGKRNASKFRKALQFLRGQSKVSFPRPIKGTLQLMQPQMEEHAVPPTLLIRC